jgi:hypothetical protein
VHDGFNPAKKKEAAVRQPLLSSRAFDLSIGGLFRRPHLRPTPGPELPAERSTRCRTPADEPPSRWRDDAYSAVESLRPLPTFSVDPRT